MVSYRAGITVKYLCITLTGDNKPAPPDLSYLKYAKSAVEIGPGRFRRGLEVPYRITAHPFSRQVQRPNRYVE